jgi:hypothetical protein
MARGLPLPGKMEEPWPEVLLEDGSRVPMRKDAGTAGLLLYLGWHQSSGEELLGLATLADMLVRLMDLGALGDRSLFEVGRKAKELLQGGWWEGELTRERVRRVVETAVVVTGERQDRAESSLFLR